MENQRVLEYKCPCCNAGLHYREGSKTLKCEYCDNTFELDTVRAYNESEAETSADTLSWDESTFQAWSETEQSSVNVFQCPSCGGEILTEETTAATFCPYCDNPTVLPGRLGGAVRPEAILPFQNTKEDAKAAFLRLCKGKPLLPKEFTQEQRLERITGVYVPFWLYSCGASFHGNYRATRIHTWSDSKYNYTRTDHFLLRRGGSAAFSNIPMDGSRKMDDTFMESIEPFDFTGLQDFNMAYLTGFLADKYDVEASAGESRIRQRVENSIEQELQPTMLGYHSVLPGARQTNIRNSRAKYVLLPVWLLNTNYNGKLYTFAMNGQTGKMTGSLPVSRQRAAAWFGGIFVIVTALAAALQLLI